MEMDTELLRTNVGIELMHDRYQRDGKLELDIGHKLEGEFEQHQQSDDEEPTKPRRQQHQRHLAQLRKYSVPLPLSPLQSEDSDSEDFNAGTETNNNNNNRNSNDSTDESEAKAKTTSKHLSRTRSSASLTLQQIHNSHTLNTNAINSNTTMYVTPTTATIATGRRGRSASVATLYSSLSSASISTSASSNSSSWLASVVEKVMEFAQISQQTIAASSSSSSSSYDPLAIANSIATSHSREPNNTTSSIPALHYSRAITHLANNCLVLAVSEFTLAATLGPEPHPEAMYQLILLHSNPDLETFDSTKAVDWTQSRLTVLATPEGMLAQAKFLRASHEFGNLKKSLKTPPWDMSSKPDKEAALLLTQAVAVTATPNAANTNSTNTLKPSSVTAEKLSPNIPPYAPAIHYYAIYLRENNQTADAVHWFTKAFALGHHTSALWLSDIYARSAPGVPMNVLLADNYRVKYELRESLLVKQRERERAIADAEMEVLKEENDFRAFRKMRRDRALLVEERDAQARREASVTFSSTVKFLEWGYYMLAVDELCSLIREDPENTDAIDWIDPDISPIPRTKSYSAPAMFHFGEYFSKRGDHARASKWYRNAAELSHYDAQVSYAAYLMQQNTKNSGGTSDPGQAIVWLMKAWDGSKHKQAAMALGDAFSRGKGVAADPQKALVWYMHAWKQGRFADAAFAVGLGYATGYTPGYVKPAVWNPVGGSGLEENNTGGGSNSTTSILSAATKNRRKYLVPKVLPIPRNFEKAVYWYELAAKHHHHRHARACNNLAEMYMLGRGTPRNEFVGFNYFARAAEEGLPAAMYNVARCYRDGRGCQQNEDTALTWFERALEYGVKEAALAIKESPLYVFESSDDDDDDEANIEITK
ncbi:hypothetical protein HK100_009597 [Physocladia obscura]|uniref:HCP-like protein n=1 Tax=Physocladia obscura TaxID=109957 RepID=A0AAD5T374_9FUNG|nr:hypothetical protein HK100_009597 [Physocladia obscura]